MTFDLALAIWKQCSLFNLTRLILWHVFCLQELTGKVPHAFPLETGERAPIVQRRVGLPHNNTKGEVRELSQILWHWSQRSCMSVNTDYHHITDLSYCFVQDETGQRRQMKTLFSGALYRHSESDRNVPNSRRTVHRGCHTGKVVLLTARVPRCITSYT